MLATRQVDTIEQPAEGAHNLWDIPILQQFKMLMEGGDVPFLNVGEDTVVRIPYIALGWSRRRPYLNAVSFEGG